MAEATGIVKRRDEVLDLVGVKGFASLSDLAATLAVSESTVRRDLEVLETQGLLQRTHGGAVSLQDSGSLRLGFSDRQTTAAPQKRAIARAVAAMIAEGQTVIVDGGTTCLEVAAALAGRRLSIITHSVPVAALLGGEVATEVTLAGGYLYPRTGVALGPRAEETFGSLRADQALISCAAVNAEGLFNINEMMTSVQRKMIAAADRVVLAVDSGKFGRRAIARLCGLEEVDVVVSDAGLDPSWRDVLEQRKVACVVAEGLP